jgi:peptidoglycan/LPS O-acetylase OafA/YrhL
MMVAFVAVGLLVVYEDWRGLGRLTMLMYGPCFLGGVLAFHLLRRGLRPTMPSWAWPITIALAALFVGLLDPTYRHPESGWIPCLLLGASVPLIRDASPSRRARAAHKICDVSYGIYLLHEPILWVAFVVMQPLPSAIKWGVFGALILSLPELGHRLIEQPGIRVGQRLAQGLSGWSARPVTA